MLSTTTPQAPISSYAPLQIERIPPFGDRRDFGSPESDLPATEKATLELVASLRDEISLLKMELSRLRDTSVLDPLTKVLNRLGLERCLKMAIAKPASKGNAHHLILVDIDHFKRVNDSYGHVMGDRVLQVLAEVLRSRVNEARMEVVARYGGEEFALLLPNSTPQYAKTFAEGMRREVEGLVIRERRRTPANVAGLAIGITISGGIAALGASDDEIAWVASSDRALYRSKMNGRNTMTVG